MTKPECIAYLKRLKELDDLANSSDDVVVSKQEIEEAFREMETADKDLTNTRT